MQQRRDARVGRRRGSRLTSTAVRHSPTAARVRRPPWRAWRRAGRGSAGWRERLACRARRWRASRRADAGVGITAQLAAEAHRQFPERYRHGRVTARRCGALTSACGRRRRRARLAAAGAAAPRGLHGAASIAGGDVVGRARRTPPPRRSAPGRSSGPWRRCALRRSSVRCRRDISSLRRALTSSWNSPRARSKSRCAVAQFLLGALPLILGHSGAVLLQLVLSWPSGTAPGPASVRWRGANSARIDSSDGLALRGLLAERWKSTIQSSVPAQAGRAARALPRHRPNHHLAAAQTHHGTTYLL